MIIDHDASAAQMREALDAALADYTPGVDCAVRFVTIDQVDMLVEFYLHNRALPVADPLCTWPSCGHTAKGQCRTYTSGQLIAPNDASITATNIPVAEPEPLADGSFYKEVDIDRLQERAEKAEAERDDWMRACNLAVQERMAAEAERDALLAALEEIADGLKGIARDIQIGPDDEGREIYDMVQALQWDARQALKGQTND